MKIETLSAHSFNGWAQGARQAMEAYVYLNEPKVLPKVMRMADEIEKISPNHTIKFVQSLLKLRTRSNMQTQNILAGLPQVFVKRNDSEEFIQITKSRFAPTGMVSVLKALKKFIEKDAKAIEKTAEKATSIV